MLDVIKDASDKDIHYTSSGDYLIVGKDNDTRIIIKESFTARLQNTVDPVIPIEAFARRHRFTRHVSHEICDFCRNKDCNTIYFQYVAVSICRSCENLFMNRPTLILKNESMPVFGFKSDYINYSIRRCLEENLKYIRNCYIAYDNNRLIFGEKFGLIDRFGSSSTHGIVRYVEKINIEATGAIREYIRSAYANKYSLLKGAIYDDILGEIFSVLCMRTIHDITV